MFIFCQSLGFLCFLNTIVLHLFMNNFSMFMSHLYFVHNRIQQCSPTVFPFCLSRFLKFNNRLLFDPCSLVAHSSVPFLVARPPQWSLRFPSLPSRAGYLRPSGPLCPISSQIGQDLFLCWLALLLGGSSPMVL